MGAPSFDMMQQQVQKAYTTVSPLPVKREIKAVVEEKPKCNDLFESIEVDGIDQAYAWVRTFVPSWMIGLMLLIGALVVLNNLLNKFGIQLISRVKKDG